MDRIQPRRHLHSVAGEGAQVVTEPREPTHLVAIGVALPGGLHMTPAYHASHMDSAPCLVILRSCSSILSVPSLSLAVVNGHAILHAHGHLSCTLTDTT